MGFELIEDEEIRKAIEASLETYKEEKIKEKKEKDKP
jgi:hypothetical protein